MRCLSIVSIALAILIGCNKEENQKVSLPPKAKSQEIVHDARTSNNIADGDTNVYVDAADLNSDGIEETIRLEFIKHSSSFTLFVNDFSITEWGIGLHGYFKIVDIDSTDSIKEIAISESGPSDDLATHLYYYDGRSIISMGTVGGIPRADGSGILRASTRGKILHTWFHSASYKLSNNHALEYIDMDLYAMNWTVTLKDTLALRESRKDSEIIVRLLPGEKVTILSSDDKEWCLVENSKGIKGWFAVDGYDKIRGTNKTARELFEGLSYAD